MNEMKSYSQAVTGVSVLLNPVSLLGITGLGLPFLTGQCWQCLAGKAPHGGVC